MSGADPWWSAQVIRLPRRPLRRIVISLDYVGYGAHVVGADGRRDPGFRSSDIYSSRLDVLTVARGLAKQTGLPLDLRAMWSPPAGEAA